MVVEVDLSLLAASCNRVNGVADWDSDDGSVVAFGSDKSVSIYNPADTSTPGISHSLQGHTDRVTAVKFIRRRTATDQRTVALISASADKSLRVWKPCPTSPQDESLASATWICSAVLTGHTEAVTAVGVARGRHIPAGLETPDYIASSSSDGSLRIWERRTSTVNPMEDHIECVQVVYVVNKYAMALGVSFLPNSDVPFIVSGGTDHKINLYVRADGKFVHTLALQGHTDWVRSIDIATFTDTLGNSDALSGFKDGDLIISTASQDKYIRLWKVADLGLSNDAAPVVKAPASVTDKPNVPVDAEDGNAAFDQALDMLQALIGEEGGEGGRQLSTKAHVIEASVGDLRRKYMVMFDALLLGHEDWVHTVCWEPAHKENGYHQPMALLSASADKSLIIWRPDKRNAIWINDARLGELGGNNLGFYGACFGPNGKKIMGYGYHGAVQFWDADPSSTLIWHPRIGLSGHFGSVQDVAWSPTSHYFVTVSLDQTTRLWAPWRRQHNGKEISSWHELGRPQIHGYDINCLAFYHGYGFVSGADEKVVRVFEGPRFFVDSLQNTSKIQESEEVVAARPAGASVPALGLSNKVVLGGVDNAAKDTAEFTLNSTALEEPPFEQHLIQHTLWPEINKLYGHGFELIAMSSTHDGELVASASKAFVAKSEHAAVRLWSTETWKEVGQLVSHTQTVAAIRFSHDDKYVVTGGRDRMWSFFERGADGKYNLVATNSKSHTRIIWDCAWSPDATMFATASRDKTVKLWRSEGISETAEAACTLKFDAAVTSIDFAPILRDTKFVLAVGLENGAIHLFHASTQSSFTPLYQIPQLNCPTGAVKRIRWQPALMSPLLLACASEDSSVRLFTVTL